MPAGFAGSHGTAAIVSDIFEGEGFVGAYSIGQTFATVGLLTGIFLGVFFVNYGAKKGYTKLIASAADLPAAMKRGLVEPEEQEPFGRVSVNSMSLDTLSWHIALVFVAVGIGYLFSKFSELVMPDFVIPVYDIALVGGIVLQNFLRWRKLEPLYGSSDHKAHWRERHGLYGGVWRGFQLILARSEDIGFPSYCCAPWVGYSPCFSCL